VRQPGSSLTAEQVEAYCRENLAAYKIPREIEFLAELPKSSVLKVLRRELRDMELAKRGG
jgi:long-chain acyl-CoA synthetase